MSDAIARTGSKSEDCEPLEDWEILTEVLMALVSRPEEVRIEERSTEESTYFVIHVAPQDLGKVIGKRGETVSVLRNLFGRIAAGRGRKTYIQIAEPGKISKTARTTSCGRNAAA